MSEPSTRQEETRAAALVFLCEQEDATEGARGILQELERRGQEGKAGYIAFIRSIAGKARQSAAAYRLISAALERASVPQDCAEVFKAYYLEGDRRPTPRELMRRFYITPRTVQRQNLKTLEALLIPLFGIDGLFLEANDKQTKAPAAGSVTP